MFGGIDHFLLVLYTFPTNSAPFWSKRTSIGLPTDGQAPLMTYFNWRGKMFLTILSRDNTELLVFICKKWLFTSKLQ